LKRKFNDSLNNVKQHQISNICQQNYSAVVNPFEREAHGLSIRLRFMKVFINFQDVTKDTELAGSVSTILSAITGLPVPTPEQRARAWRDFWNKLDEALK